MRTFAVGDIHGCNEAFQAMLFDKLKIVKADDIYCVGDFIDRGPDSKEVIDTILKLRKDGYSIHTLRGNHEQMMIESTMGEDEFKRWYLNGGDATLLSFGVNGYSGFSEEYRNFFETTHYYLQNGDYIFVHAGLDFKSANIFEDQEAMLWARGFKAQQNVLGNKILIHGHTPKSLDYVLSQKANCINIDGGCVYNDEPGLGNLIAISLPDKEMFVVAN